MNLPKQDRNGVRTPTDIERRYRLGKINTTEQRVEEIEKNTTIDTTLSTSSTRPVQNKVITKALGDKVDKEDGKGLSTNDFTDAHMAASHTHTNKTILDSITQEDIDNWNTPKQYYVGDVYITTNEENPAIRLGYGTWKSIATETIVDADVTSYTLYTWLRTN